MKKNAEQQDYGHLMHLCKDRLDIMRAVILFYARHPRVVLDKSALTFENALKLAIEQHFISKYLAPTQKGAKLFRIIQDDMKWHICRSQIQNTEIDFNTLYRIVMSIYGDRKPYYYPCDLRDGKICTYANMDCNPASIRCKKSQKTHYAPAPVSNSSSTTSNNTRKPRTQINYIPPQKISGVLLYTDMDPQPVIRVFRGYLSLPKNHLQDFLIKTKDIISGMSLNVYAIYDLTSERYYLDIIQLKYLRKQGKIPALRLTYANSKECTNAFGIDEMREQSILGIYGYKVGKAAGLTESARHRLLIYVMQNHIMYPHAIVRLLNGHIAFREGRSDVDYSVAIREWSNDIIFIQKYVKNNYALDSIEYMSMPGPICLG